MILSIVTVTTILFCWYRTFAIVTKAVKNRWETGKPDYKLGASIAEEGIVCISVLWYAMQTLEDYYVL